MATKTLIAGENFPLNDTEIKLKIQYFVSQGELDISAYLLSEQTGKVRGDNDMLFFGQRYAENGAISLEISPNESSLQINTAAISPEIKKIAICATIDGAENLSILQSLQFELQENGKLIANANEQQTNRLEAALILAEIYKHNDAWKCRWVMQGFNGGLPALAEFFGIEVLDESQDNALITDPNVIAEREISPEPMETQRIILNHDNHYLRIENKKLFGHIKINLAWQSNSQEKSGFLSHLFGMGTIDLDLGAMVRLKDGSAHVVQALGNQCGSRHSPPFIELQGDDRTGEKAEGEWLFLNAEHWQEIDLIVIFCFVYRGKEWPITTVFLDIPEQMTIEIPLSDYDQNLGLCGVLELRNQGGDLGIQRIMKYFVDHKKLDQYYGFGIEWERKQK